MLLHTTKNAIGQSPLFISKENNNMNKGVLEFSADFSHLPHYQDA